jgi:hypothetical protein
VQRVQLLLLFLDQALQSLNRFGVYTVLLSRNYSCRKQLDCQQQHDGNNEEKSFHDFPPSLISRAKNAPGSGAVYFPNVYIQVFLKPPAVGKKLPVVCML